MTQGRGRTGGGDRKKTEDDEEKWLTHSSQSFDNRSRRTKTTRPPTAKSGLLLMTLRARVAYKVCEWMLRVDVAR